MTDFEYPDLPSAWVAFADSYSGRTAAPIAPGQYVVADYSTVSAGVVTFILNEPTYPFAVAHTFSCGTPENTLAALKELNGDLRWRRALTPYGEWDTGNVYGDASIIALGRSHSTVRNAIWGAPNVERTLVYSPSSANVGDWIIAIAQYGRFQGNGDGYGYTGTDPMVFDFGTCGQVGGSGVRYPDPDGMEDLASWLQFIGTGPGTSNLGPAEINALNAMSDALVASTGQTGSLRKQDDTIIATFGSPPTPVLPTPTGTPDNAVSRIAQAILARFGAEAGLVLTKPDCTVYPYRGVIRRG